MAAKIVIGMTGPFGSGCSYVCKNILAKLGYEYISLSEILRETTSKTNAPRTELQDVGNKLRAQNGNEFLANEAIKRIEASDKGGKVKSKSRKNRKNFLGGGKVGGKQVV